MPSCNRHSLEYPKDRFNLGRSPDGDLLSSFGESSSYSRTIIQWNASTGESVLFDPDIAAKKEQQQGSYMQDVLTCLAYSPDGRVLAAGNQAGNIILIDSRSGDILRTLEGSRRNMPILQLVFVDDGTAILGNGFEVLRWKLSDNDKPVKASVLFKPAGDEFVMSANGVVGASVVNHSTEIVVQEVRTGEVIDSWNPKLEEIEGIEVSANGAFLAAWPGLRRDSEAGQVKIHHRLTRNGDAIIRHLEPKYWNRHSEILAVYFTE